eukprot:578448-Hanusia_phi.AAC.1
MLLGRSCGLRGCEVREGTRRETSGQGAAVWKEVGRASGGRGGGYEGGEEEGAEREDMERRKRGKGGEGSRERREDRM